MASADDPLGVGAPSLAPSQQQAPRYIGVDVWAAPTYPGATPFSPPTTIAPLSPSLASVAPPTNPALAGFPGAIGVLGPKYEEGAENTVGRWTVEKVARMQERMVKAGLIDKKQRFKYGLADDTTVRAYYGLLGFANRYGITDDEALTRLETTPMTGPEEDKPEGPRTERSFKETPAANARLTLRKIAEEELGRAPSAREYRVYQRLLAAQEQATPTVSTRTPTLDAEGNDIGGDTHVTGLGEQHEAVLADQFVRSGEMGVERNTRKAVDYMDQAMTVLGAGGQAVGFGA